MKNLMAGSLAIALALSGCARSGTNMAQAQSGDQFDKFVATYDRDGDNRLNIRELSNSFAKASALGMPRPSDAEIREIIKSYDLNGDGFVTAEELRRLKERNKFVRP